MARGRPLQVARDARQRRGRAPLHGRRVPAREIRRLGGDGPADAWKPPLPLVAPRAAALLRVRRPDRPRDRRRNLGHGRRKAALAARARHPRGEPGGGRLHYGRSGRFPRRTREDQEVRPEDARLPGFPARQGARRRGPRGVQPVGRAAVRCGALLRALARRLPRGPEDEARRLPRGWRQAVGPRDGHRPCGAVHPRRGGRHFQGRPGGPRGRVRRRREIRVVPDAGVRPLGRPPRLDQAAAPRRPARRQHAAPAPARAGHGLRLDRRFPAGARPWPLP